MGNLFGRLLLVLACLLSFPTSSHAHWLSELVERVFALATKKAPHKTPTNPPVTAHPSPPSGPLQDGGSAAGSQFPVGPIVRDTVPRMIEEGGNWTSPLGSWTLSRVTVRRIYDACRELNTFPPEAEISIEGSAPIEFRECPTEECRVVTTVVPGAYAVKAIGVVEDTSGRCWIKLKPLRPVGVLSVYVSANEFSLAIFPLEQSFQLPKDQAD